MTVLKPSPAAVADDLAVTVLGRTYRALSVGIVSVVLLIAFEATAVGTAMPVVARELDGVSVYAFAFSGFFTTSLFGMVLAGQWSDRRGPLSPLTWGIGAFAGGLVLCGTAGAMWVFIAGRAVQGLGGGLVIVALYVVVGRAYPEPLRPAIMAAFAASWVVPSVVGPLASGAITEHAGWRWVFLGIPALVVFPLALALPQIRRRAGGPVGGGDGARGGAGGGASTGSGVIGSSPGPTAHSSAGSGVDSAAGTSVGSSAGADVASAAGSSAGSGVGSGVGFSVGSDGGSPAGSLAGSGVGSSAGSGVGSGVGSSVGSDGGSPSGSSAGSGVGSSAGSLAGADTDSPSGSVDRRRIRLALAVSLGAGLLQYAAQDLRPLSLLPGVVGAALLVPAVLGLLPRGTWRAARGLPSVVLLRGLAAGSFIAAESFVPLMLVTQRGLSPTLAGFSLAAGGATWALGSWVQARPRVAPYRERLMTAGMLLTAAAIVAAPSVLIDSVPVWTVAVAWGFGCFGMGLVISSVSVLLLQLSAPEEAGTNSAALQISDALSNVLLLAAGGAAFAALGGGSIAHTATEAAASGSHPTAFVAVFLPMAGVALLGAWVTRRLRDRTR
ncbi:MFS transporter [Streptomyces sp. NPDC018693]|uniref:MFS transporter n=1 Tax=Streptomyces sp. NPDC018693 TaxID=3365051 RepID=UPI0037A99EDC